jgi:hypothetical protein
MLRRVCVSLFASIAFVGGSTARAQCPGWSPGFGTVGVDDSVSALTVFDDGSGPALYAGGSFHSADGNVARHVARWDGTHWSPVGAGIDSVDPTFVSALTSFDDGSGSALFAAGLFATLGGTTANNIAKWDGVSWSPLSTGLTGPSSTVNAMTVYDDGSGAALYVGGFFTAAGGVSASRIAKWNGTTWSAVGSGLDNSVAALAVFDDGSGPALYAGGSFTHAGGIPASRIAKWNGNQWSALGTGANGNVYTLVVHDDGSGSALYAAGSFSSVGGSSANLVGRWNGSSWTGMNPGLTGFSASIASADDGSGAKLYCSDSSQIKRWDGTSWSFVAAVSAYCMATFDEGAGPHAFIGGGFTKVGNLVASRIVRGDGANWSAVSEGQSGINDNVVDDLAAVDLGTGTELYAAGLFVTAGNTTANRIARFDGTNWHPLGSGLSDYAHALISFDDGSGVALYAGGAFGVAGGVPASRVAKWNGSSWSALGAGTVNEVWSLIGFDDGTGPALYAGGELLVSSGAPGNGIAKWDGSTWTPLGSGVTGFGLGLTRVHSMAVFDDGTGPALYAGGVFNMAGGVPASSIARWNGSAWSSVGGSASSDGEVAALVVFDDGTGPALYAGGSFNTLVGVPASSFAKWNGTSWTGISGVHDIIDMAVFDDGNGPAMFVTGYFADGGGTGSRNVARWNGSSWSGLGQGLLPPGSGGSLNFGRAAAVYDDGHGAGPAIFFGGSFSLVDNLAAKNIAKWQGCGHVGVAYCAEDGSLNCPCGNSGTAGHGCNNSAATGGALLASSGWNSLAHDSLVLMSSGELPSALSIFLQGSTLIAPTSFGDGLRCAGGALKRLYSKNASAGSVSAPTLGDLSISARSAALGDVIDVGESRVYQVYYRDPNLAFCPTPAGKAWNVSSGLRISWLP